jgi:phosphoglycolate phosphatase
MNLIFDLDGTLIDSTLRLYKLFQSLVPNSKLTYDEYWELKRNKINHKEILTSKFNYTTEAYELFEKEWMIEIEKTQWLALDKPFEGVTQMLIDLSQYHKLFLVTDPANRKKQHCIKLKVLVGSFFLIKYLLLGKSLINLF